MWVMKRLALTLNTKSSATASRHPLKAAWVGS